MNKYQEALDYLISNGTHTTEYSWGDEIEVETERGEESVNLLQELVDRATPMEHIAELCPTCYESVHLLVTELNKVKQTLFYEVSYCCKCGQAIDWSEDDE